MAEFLIFCAYLLAMLATVPLFGLLVFGSWRDAWRFSRAWGASIGWMIAAALVLAAILFPVLN